MNDVYVYAVRNTDTGKLVSNLTNPRRKYWDTERNCQKAIINYQSNNSLWCKDDLKMVKFKLTEVK